MPLEYQGIPDDLATDSGICGHASTGCSPASSSNLFILDTRVGEQVPDEVPAGLVSTDTAGPTGLLARSVAISTAAWQHACDVDRARLGLEQHERSPVADPQPPLGRPSQLPERASPVAILCQSTQRTLYALTNRRVQAP